MESLKDEELVKKILNGEEKAFDTLYRRHARKVYSIIARIVKDEHLAEDTMQEVFIKIHNNLKKFKFKSAFFTWLYRIAVNTALTNVKKKSRLKENTINQEMVEYETSPDKEFQGKYVREQIDIAVDNLPEKQKLIFNLRFYEGLQYADISKITNISLSSCKTNYHYAVNSLKEKLGGLL